MGRPLAECGTDAAYKRHLRRNETPCRACKIAHRDAQRARRARDKQPAPDPELVAQVEVPEQSETAPEPSEDGEPDRREDLIASRGVLWSSIEFAAHSDPVKVGGLVKELRAVWRDLTEIDENERVEEDPFSDFLNDDAGGGVVTRFPSPADRAHA